MVELPFSSPERAADDISVLCDYLRCEDDGQYLYRGQRRDYGRPLLPSAFRVQLPAWERFDANSGFFGYRVRGLGRVFFGNIAGCMSDGRDRDWDDRSIIRQRFLDAFGYLLGSSLAQHYGIQSEHLDVTEDVDIAAFFATHAPPRYLLCSPQEHTECGLIYRFRRPLSDASSHSIRTSNYFNAPGALLSSEIFRQFEADLSLEESLDSVCCYYELWKATGERYHHLIKLPRGFLADSRLGRQRAAVIIPDEIHIAAKGAVVRPHPIFGTPGIVLGERMPLTFQAVEDLAMREGTTAFYFRHTGVESPGEIRPDDLWPNDRDVLLKAVVALMSETFSPYARVVEPTPSRFDLVDAGFGTFDAHEILQFLAENGAREDECLRTVRYAENIIDRGERLEYYVKRAGGLFHAALLSSDGTMLRSSIGVCQEAIKIDETSIVLYILLNLAYYALGDHRMAQVAIGQAMKCAQSPEGIEIVQKVLRDLYLLQGNPVFPERFVDYYMTF
jgi:hypothetical protein